MLAPWLVDNLHRYGAVTAVSLMKAMQGGFLNPGDRPYGVTRLAHADVALLNGMLPEEWANTTLTLYRTGNSLPLSVLHLLRGALVVLLAGPLALWVVRGPRRLWLLVAPLLVGLVLTQLETVIVRLPLDQPRYLYPTLPAAGLLAGITCVRSAGVRLTTALAGALTIGLAGLWLYLATVPTLPGS
jgi:hypothetical protein